MTFESPKKETYEVTKQKKKFEMKEKNCSCKKTEKTRRQKMK